MARLRGDEVEHQPAQVTLAERAAVSTGTAGTAWPAEPAPEASPAPDLVLSEPAASAAQRVVVTSGAAVKARRASVRRIDVIGRGEIPPATAASAKSAAVPEKCGTRIVSCLAVAIWFQWIAHDVIIGRALGTRCSAPPMTPITMPVAPAVPMLVPMVER
jgi:hypothetical protein